LDINGLDHEKGVILLLFFFLVILTGEFLHLLFNDFLGNRVFVLEGKYSFFNDISGDFEIFNDGTDYDFEHTESHWFLLEFGFPDESVHLYTKDSRAKIIEIDVGTVRFDFPNNDGLGDDGWFCLFGFGFFSLLFSFSGSGFVFFSFLTKQIITVIGSGFLLPNLFFIDLLDSGWLRSILWGFSGPLSTDGRCKLASATPPGKSVGGGFDAGSACHCLKSLTISSSGLLSTKPLVVCQLSFVSQFCLCSLIIHKNLFNTR
jgi:hypothetical protein